MHLTWQSQESVCRATANAFAEDGVEQNSCPASVLSLAGARFAYFTTHAAVFNVVRDCQVCLPQH